MAEISGNEKGRRQNHHGTCLIIGDRGIAITGSAGSGKTGLALQLIERTGAAGTFARLVADDQMWLHPRGTRLVCRAPGEIAGKIELRGAGIASLPHEPAAVLHLWIELLPVGEIPRMPERADMVTKIAGVTVPSLKLCQNRACENAVAILCRLGIGRFAAANNRP